MNQDPRRALTYKEWVDFKIEYHQNQARVWRLLAALFLLAALTILIAWS